MKILFIGGTGIISSACSDRCIENGNDLFLLNRGNSPNVGLTQYTQITADISDEIRVKAILA